MKNKKVKLTIFITLIILMLSYIVWIFYLSEPKYINNCHKNIEKYDYVSIYEHKYNFQTHYEVLNGIVLQVDTNSALIKCKDYSEHFYEIDLKNSKYRIIGSGTFYHKVNNYVGFNIMLISQVFIGILLLFIIISLTGILKDLLN